MRLIALGSMLLLSLSLGCAPPWGHSPTQREPVISLEPTDAIAYVTGVQVSVFMITTEKVVEISIPLAKTRQKGRCVVLIGEGKAAATLSQGKNVVEKVLPRGDLPPFPPPRDPSQPPPPPPYTGEEAIEGRIVCADIPAAMTFPYLGDTAIQIIRVDLRFPSGRLRLDRKMSLVLRPLPP